MKFFTSIKKEVLLFMVLVALAAPAIMYIYLNDLEYNIIAITLLCILMIAINRSSIPLQKRKTKTKKYLVVFAEACFILYLIFIAIFGDVYFLHYKILIIPSFILSIYLLSGLKKAKAKSIRN